MSGMSACVDGLAPSRKSRIIRNGMEQRCQFRRGTSEVMRPFCAPQGADFASSIVNDHDQKVARLYCLEWRIIAGSALVSLATEFRLSSRHRYYVRHTA